MPKYLVKVSYSADGTRRFATYEVPSGVDEAAVRQALLKDHQIEIGAGLGPLAGRIWRVGLMGHTARPENVDRVLKALAGQL